MKKNAFGLETKKTPVAIDPPKTQLIELRKLILMERADDVVKKVLDIALDDEHPSQGAALKMCLERILPMSAFEDAKAQGRGAITINISGVNDPVTIDGEEVGDDNVKF